MHIFKTMDTCFFFSENAWKRCSHTLSSQILFISVFYMNFTWIYNTNVIHSGYLYSTSSSPLLLRGAPDTAYTVSEFHAKAPQATASEGLAQGPYIALVPMPFVVVLLSSQNAIQFIGSEVWSN